MLTLINDKKLISRRVSSSPIRVAKNVQHNGIYYEFNKVGDTYPLELAMAQINTLSNYEMIFIEKSDKNGFLGVFIKTPTRKTIYIDKIHFFSQIIKYKEIFKAIAIVNNTELFENQDYQRDIDFFSNVDFVSVEKLPDLIDPSRKQALIRRYLISFIFITFYYLSSSLYINNLEDKVSFFKNELKRETNLFAELNQKFKKQNLEAPSQEIQNKQVEQILSKIDSGELK